MCCQATTASYQLARTRVFWENVAVGIGTHSTKSRQPGQRDLITTWRLLECTFSTLQNPIRFKSSSFNDLSVFVNPFEYRAFRWSIPQKTKETNSPQYTSPMRILVRNCLVALLEAQRPSRRLFRSRHQAVQCTYHLMEEKEMFILPHYKLSGQSGCRCALVLDPLTAPEERSDTRTIFLIADVHML